MNIFFTADTHFHHGNLAKHRGFSSVEEMDELMIQRWNATVGKGDMVWHLGDFSWYPSKEKTQALRARLKGRINFIRGNHDPKSKWFQALFESFNNFTIVKYTTIPFVLCHYAMRVWPSKHYGTAHLFGHSHGSLRVHENECCMDVGVDCHDFAPIPLELIFNYMKPRSELVLQSRNNRYEQTHIDSDPEIRHHHEASLPPVEEGVQAAAKGESPRAEGSHAKCYQCSRWEPRVRGGSGLPRVGKCTIHDKLTFDYHGCSDYCG